MVRFIIKSGILLHRYVWKNRKFVKYFRFGEVRSLQNEFSTNILESMGDGENFINIFIVERNEIYKK